MRKIKAAITLLYLLLLILVLIIVTSGYDQRVSIKYAQVAVDKLTSEAYNNSIIQTDHPITLEGLRGNNEVMLFCTWILGIILLLVFFLTRRLSKKTFPAKGNILEPPIALV